MFAWETPLTLQDLLLDLALVSLLLVLSTVLRRYVRFFQTYLVPNCLIAGFLGLLVGPEVLGWAGFSVERMGMYVYHLLALLFIGMGLRGSSQRSLGSVWMGFTAMMCYLAQAVVGLTTVLLLVHLAMPDLPPSFGLLLPLGFGMGPGLALTIGQSWEAYGVEGAGSVGLTLAAMGFLVAYLLGVALVNRGIRRGESALIGSMDEIGPDVRTGLVSSDPECGARLTLHAGAVEPLTFHVACIGGLYLATFGLVKGLEQVFPLVGLEKEVPLLYSFHFLWAFLLTLLVRRLVVRSGGVRVLDTGLLNRITGACTDFMIAASIMAINLQVARAFAVPILVMVGSGTAVTYFSLRWASKRAYKDYVFERLVGSFGWMTGTLSSGLALVRVTDPEFRTTVAHDLALGSGVALVLGFPLLLVINLPFTVFGGALAGYWTVLGLCMAYLALLYPLWLWFNGRDERPAGPR